MHNRMTRREALKTLGLGASGLLAGAWLGSSVRAADQEGGRSRWRRGNLHMHTYWSDGRVCPELAVDLYKKQGYDFIGLSDHNVFASDSNRWKTVEERAPLDAYLQAFGGEAETRQEGGKTAVRLKTYAELQKRFDEPDRFLLLPALEVTQVLNGIQVHLNYVNLPGEIPCIHGGPLSKKIEDASLSVSALIGQNAAEVSRLAAELQRPSLLMLNHPQWVYWDIAPQNLIDNPSVRFFEVCNGGSAFPPHPDAMRHTLDTFWDAVNAFRCLNGSPLLFGIGTDDTHHYVNRTPEQRMFDAWVMVRSAALTPDALLAAMHAGDFYATTGVLLDDVAFDPARRTLRVKVQAAPDVAYRIRFITTKRGFDQTVRTVEVPAVKGHGARAIPVYSEDVGRTVQLAEGPEASYTMASDDLYVRAKIESSVPSGYERHFHPEVQVAWTQPYGAA